MGKLTKRGWESKTPTIDPDDAQEFYQRCQFSHTAEWRLRVTRVESGSNVELADFVPVTGGTLVMDSSDPTRRTLTVEVGGGEDWTPKTANDPLVPFGQCAHLYVRIDRADGTWFPWLKLFEGPIRSNVFERPSLITTLDCADYSSVLDDFLHVHKRSYGNRSVTAALSQMAQNALPEAVYNVEAAPSADNTRVDKFIADAGQGRWDASTTLAGNHEHEAFFDWNGDLVIRRDVTDDDDDDWDPASVGPDIGTASNPAVIVRDGEGGNLVGITATVGRDGAANGVCINVTGLVPNPRRKHKKKAPAFTDGHWSTGVIQQETGSAAWGDRFGRSPLVISKQVHKITNEVKNQQTRRAHKLLHRRRGLVRYLDIATLPLYWAEPDDKIRVTFNGHTEAHYIQRVEIPLDGGPMQIKTRQLSVTDPGDLG